MRISESLFAVVFVTMVSCGQENEDLQPSLPAGGAMDTKFSFYLFTPKVINPAVPGDVLLEVRNKDASDFILHTSWNSELQMHDDGRNGDRVAGDSIFSVLIDAELIAPLVGPTSVNRPLIGQYSLKAGFASIFAEVWSSDIPLLTPENLGGSAQRTPHLLNIVAEEISPDNLEQYAREFYSHFTDTYDFVIVIYPGFNLNRHHIDVKLDVRGIGKPAYDNTAAYGSGGNLQGITVFPNTTFFDGASVAWQHELGHQWINFLSGTAAEPGIPHWPLSDLANSIMGYSRAGGQGLTFAYNLVPTGNNAWQLQPKTDPRVFNDLELYLMGLISTDQVSPHIIFENQNQVVHDYAIINGPVTTITINDIVSRFGERDPNYLNAKKEFRIATIIVSNALLSNHEMSFYDYFSSRAELEIETDVREGYSFYKSKPFFLSTGGRGKVSTTLD